jgi:hypothetical protein
MGVCTFLLLFLQFVLYDVALLEAGVSTREFILSRRRSSS